MENTIIFIAYEVEFFDEVYKYKLSRSVCQCYVAGSEQLWCHIINHNMLIFVDI